MKKLVLFNSATAKKYDVNFFYGETCSLNLQLELKENAADLEENGFGGENSC